MTVQNWILKANMAYAFVWFLNGTLPWKKFNMWFEVQIPFGKIGHSLIIARFLYKWLWMNPCTEKINIFDLKVFLKPFLNKWCHICDLIDWYPKEKAKITTNFGNQWESTVGIITLHYFDFFLKGKSHHRIFSALIFHPCYSYQH